MHLRADVRFETWSDFNFNVLISGGTAAARRTAANAIHRNTYPRGGPFVVVGDGDSSRRQLQQVLSCEPDWGTVFVEEVSRFDERMQRSLLQFVRSPVDSAVRLITATGGDLFERVRSARFCSDLFYRLNVIHLVLELDPLEAYG